MEVNTKALDLRSESNNVQSSLFIALGDDVQRVLFNHERYSFVNSLAVFDGVDRTRRVLFLSACCVFSALFVCLL